jgi:hypothetical protein
MWNGRGTQGTDREGRAEGDLGTGMGPGDRKEDRTGNGTLQFKHMRG